MALELDQTHPLAQGLTACLMPFGPNGGLWDLSGNGTHPLVSPNAPSVVTDSGRTAWQYTAAQAIILDPIPMRLFGVAPHTWAVMYRSNQVLDGLMWGGFGNAGAGQAFYWWPIPGQLNLYLYPNIANTMLTPPQAGGDGQVRIMIATLWSTLATATNPTVPPDVMPSESYSWASSVSAPEDLSYASRSLGDPAFSGTIFGYWTWNRILSMEEWDALATNPLAMFLDDTPPPVTAAVPINVAVMA